MPTDTNTQVNIINLLREPHQIWNHSSQRHNSWSFGKLWLSTSATTSELEDQSILRNLVVSHSMFKLNCQRFTVRDILIQKLTSSLKDRKEKTFIIWSQFLLLINLYKLIWADIQEKKRSLRPKVNIQFTSKDIDVFMPTQFQLLPLQCLELMLSRMLLPLFSWLWPISSNMIETLILHGVFQMLDAHIETWPQFFQEIWVELSAMPNLKTKWSDKSHQFQLCGQPHTIKPGLIQLLDHWLRNQIKLWQIHWTKRQQLLKSWVLISHHLAVSLIHQRIEFFEIKWWFMQHIIIFYILKIKCKIHFSVIFFKFHLPFLLKNKIK